MEIYIASLPEWRAHMQRGVTVPFHEQPWKIELKLPQIQKVNPLPSTNSQVSTYSTC